MIKERWCKSALTSSRLPGIDYSLNPYVGCAHGCIYCYVPSTLHVSREEWNKAVYAKVNIPAVLRRELKTKRKGIVGISTSTDAYQTAEKNYELTRKCLMLLLKHDWPIDILTKSNLVVRDIDIIKKFSEAKVGFTITTLNDESRKIFEPYAPSIEKRIEALKKFADRGIYTYAFLGPLYPEIEENEIDEWVDLFNDTGVKEIIIDNFHLKGDVWENMSRVLSKEKKKLYEKRISGNYYEKIYSEFKKKAKGKIVVSRAFV